jgi:hypothetical protein
MLLPSLLFACATLNVASLPTNELYADDGDVVKASGPVQFAVLGDVRPAMPGESARGRVVTPDTEARIVQDISEAVQRNEVGFAVLLGDLVPLSTTAEWRAFTQDWSPVLAGTEPPQMGKLRVRSVPVAGNHDHYSDPQLQGFGATFPGVGVDIGYGRVASWYAFDVRTGGATWRLMVLDSDRAALQSRWDEQLAWIPKALEGEYDGLLVFMHHPRWTLARGQVPNEGNAPQDLLDEVEGATRIGALKAVFAGHAHTNELFLPGGRFGEAYVVAGGGGSPADSLPRWGTVEGADMKLEQGFDMALVRQFDAWAEALALPSTAVDKARAGGSFEGFTGELDARYMPVQGWWNVGLDGKQLRLTFRMLGHDGTFKDIYQLENDPKEGWSASGPR